MYLKQTKRNGRVFLSVVRSYREGGRVRTKTVERIGYADAFADVYPDPVAHFRQYVTKLNERERESAVKVRIELDPNALIDPDEAGNVQLGSALALGYLDALGAGSFFGGQTGRVFELLASARMLHAVPVHETWNVRARFPRKLDCAYADAYRALEAVSQRVAAFAAHLNSSYEQVHGPRKLDVAHLVFSNYTFSWPRNAAPAGPDEVAFSGEARLCLLIDAEGIPAAYRIVPRDMGVAAMLALIDELKSQSGAQRIVLVAAQLAGADAAIDAILAHGHGVVLLQPAESFSNDLAEWVEADADYRATRNGAFRIKSRLSSRSVSAPATAQAGASVVPMKEIALRSAVQQRPADTGAPAFCIVSSEVQRSDAYVFNIYRELWRVHEPFQVIPADFIAMPYPLESAAHLRAHFLICYTAFFALRVLRQDMGWRFDAAQVADALLAMEGAYVGEGWYVFNYRTPVTDAVERACGVDAGRRALRRADIRHATVTAARNAGRGGKTRTDA